MFFGVLCIFLLHKYFEGEYEERHSKNTLIQIKNPRIATRVFSLTLV